MAHDEILQQVTNYVKSDCDLTYDEIVEGISSILGIDDYVSNRYPQKHIKSDSEKYHKNEGLLK